MRAAVLLCLAMSACGGGPGGSTDEPEPPPPPPPSDRTAQVVSAWGEDYEAVITAYEENRVNRERAMAASGNFGSGSHYAAFRDDCINYANNWTQRARNAVAAAEQSGSTNRSTLSNLVEDYRQDFLDYMLASYDDFHTRANLGGAGPAQIRDEIIAGINAVFDDLQGDV